MLSRRLVCDRRKQPECLWSKIGTTIPNDYLANRVKLDGRKYVWIEQGEKNRSFQKRPHVDNAVISVGKGQFQMVRHRDRDICDMKQFEPHVLLQWFDWEYRFIVHRSLPIDKQAAWLTSLDICVVG